MNNLLRYYTLLLKLPKAIKWLGGMFSIELELTNVVGPVSRGEEK